MRKKLELPLVVISLAAAAILAAASYGVPKDKRWKADELIKPEQLEKMLSGKSKDKPLVLQVGFEFLYYGGHIDGSIWAGPASTANGITKLKNAVKGIPKNKEIVLYCGCCPWAECPNIQPAFDTMRKLGFKDVKVLYLPSNFEQDWISKGYPTEKSPTVGAK